MNLSREHLRNFYSRLNYVPKSANLTSGFLFLINFEKKKLFKIKYVIDIVIDKNGAWSDCYQKKKILCLHLKSRDLYKCATFQQINI
ncbi:hypothetical protein BpHYR1_039356 [Brachionus plicatilis]|uniref:Uncharacterized protein n=1 Tax=Brachionus plicatilis TaxID=10195 RepID=A0A3M7QX92_BRAPC|nr:hypothetical protein BpHYR1_039356 [Brachionus plicatilis]